jgi:hypothetical protein
MPEFFEIKARMNASAQDSLCALQVQVVESESRANQKFKILGHCWITVEN